MSQPGFYCREHIKSDQRRLWLYSTRLHDLPVTHDLAPLPPPNPQMRWHPLRDEWVAYATHRQDRTFLPPPGFCPLCAVQQGAYPGEIPFADFEVAVFQNRFPGFHLDATHSPNPGLPIPTAPAIGQCEVVVFSADHSGSLATLGQARREVIVRAWADRIQKLMADPRIKAVMPFENRGQEVGVTLHHPHGQIYAFSFLPPVIEKMAAAFRKSSVLEDLWAKVGDNYQVDGDAHITAFVPPFQRYPYEVWVAPRRRVPSPDQLTDAETSALAAMLGRVVARYDALFNKPFPYILLLYTAPKGEESQFHFHIQFLPYLRTESKLKYLAGCETGAGTFLVDSAPESTVAQLREVQI